MKRETLQRMGWVIIASLVVAAVSGYVARWYLALYSSITLLCFLLGCLIILISLIALLWRKNAPAQRRNSAVAKWLLVGIFLLGQFSALPIGQAFRGWEVRRAQAYIEALIPQIESYHHQNDVYPPEINSIISGSENPLPSLLQLKSSDPFAFDNHEFYLYQEITYAFEFYLPDGFIGFQYRYCCGSNGTWTVTD